MQVKKNFLGWGQVFGHSDDGAEARSNLLCATIAQQVVSGLSSGTFYTGFLLGYGIDVVSISLLSIVPYACSMLTFFTPLILDRFPKRRKVLSVTRIIYYGIQILGITLIPMVVQSPDLRVWGLVGVIILANVIHYLFYPGYSPWHMSHLVPEVRDGYYAATNVVSLLSSSGVSTLAGFLADRLTGNVQQSFFILMRFLAFGVAMLDVYYLQKPKEPVYSTSRQHFALLDVLKIPLSNSKFSATMLVFGLYQMITSFYIPAHNVWLLTSVHCSYGYIGLVNCLAPPFVILTQHFWSGVKKKLGTFRLLSLSLVLYTVSYVGYSFVNAENYLWLMTAVRIWQHIIWPSLIYTVNELVYINLPKKDQTCYISFYTILNNLATPLGMLISTFVVGKLGNRRVPLAGAQLESAPLMFLAMGICYLLLAVFVMKVRKFLEPNQTGG